MTQHESTATETKKNVTAFLAHYRDIEGNLIQTSRLGVAGFKDQKAIFEECITVIQELEKIDLLKIPLPLVRNLNRELHYLTATFESINKFDINSGDIPRAKSGLNNSLEEHQEKFLTPALNVIAFNSISNKPQIETEAEKIIGFRKKIEEESKTASEKIKTAIASISTEAKDLGISRYSKIFETQSVNHRDTSIWWLVAIVILLLGSLGYGIYLTNLMDDIKSDLTNNNYVLLITITRILIIAILFYAISLSIKNYKSHKHNQIVNQHRHNALVTFETFVTAAGTDEDTKNAVLLEATRSIFAGQNTGYFFSDSDGENPANKIIEIIKSSKDTRG